MLLRKLKKLFQETRPADQQTRQDSVRFAVAAALLEISYADFDIAQEELAQIAETLAKRYDLSDAERDLLIAEARAEHEQRTSLYDCLKLINDTFSMDEKIELINDLWKVAWADGRIDKHETHRLRRLAGLLHVPHREFIRARHATAPLEKQNDGKEQTIGNESTPKGESS